MKKYIIMVLLIALLGCQKEYQPKSASEAVNIAITSDIHYIDKSLMGNLLYESLERSDGKLTIYIDTLVSAFVEDMLESKPDLVVITGDLSFNGERISHETLAKKLNKLNRAGIKTLVIPGNHDILNAHAIDYSKEEAYRTDTVTVDDYRKIYNDFGYSDAYSTDPSSLSYIYKASDSLYLLMLDSNTYEKNSGFAPSSEGYIRKETLSWLEDELSKIEDANKLVFLHHPVLNVGANEEYHITNDTEFLNFMTEYDLKLAISGHIHAQNYLEKTADNILITNFGISSLAVYDHQYTLLSYEPDEAYNLEAINVNVEGYAKKHNLNDEFFTDFDNNAFEYFKKYSTTRLTKRFVGDDIPSDLSDKLFELKGIFNAYEFKGEAPAFKEIFESDEDYERILEYKSSYASTFFNVFKYFYNDATKLTIMLK